MKTTKTTYRLDDGRATTIELTGKLSFTQKIEVTVQQPHHAGFKTFSFPATACREDEAFSDDDHAHFHEAAIAIYGQSKRATKDHGYPRANATNSMLQDLWNEIKRHA